MTRSVCKSVPHDPRPAFRAQLAQLPPVGLRQGELAIGSLQAVPKGLRDVLRMRVGSEIQYGFLH